MTSWCCFCNWKFRHIDLYLQQTKIENIMKMMILLHSATLKGVFGDPFIEQIHKLLSKISVGYNFVFVCMNITP